MLGWISRRCIAAAGILLLVVGCVPAQVSAPSPAILTGSPIASATPSPRAIPSPAPSATFSPTPSPLPPLTELGGLLRSLGTGWRPSGEALVIEQPGGIDGTLLVAVPVDAASRGTTPLVAFGPSVGWDVRRDGSAITIALATGLGSSRIASWDPRTGAARWVTPDEPGVLHGTPIWSADGRAIYYAALRAPDDLGIFRAGVDGSRPTRIRAPEGNGAQLEGLTPDGRGLVWARVQAGGSTEVLDLATGRTASFEGSGPARPLAWRSARPRALVLSGGCCAGRTGTLVIWDDIDGSSRALFGSRLTPQEAVGSADWDAEGKRIVAVVYDTTISSDVPGPLLVMDEHGGTRSTIPGTEGAGSVMWLSAGIVFVKGTTSAGAQLFVVPPTGGTPTSIFRGGYIGTWKVVAP